MDDGMETSDWSLVVVVVDGEDRLTANTTDVVVGGEVPRRTTLPIGWRRRRRRRPRSASSSRRTAADTSAGPPPSKERKTWRRKQLNRNLPDRVAVVVVEALVFLLLLRLLPVSYLRMSANRKLFRCWSHRMSPA